MEIALVLLILCTCNVYLSVAGFRPQQNDMKTMPCNGQRTGDLSRHPRFEPIIHGWEKECEASNCRYTGRITGSIKAFGFERPQPQSCVFYMVRFKISNNLWPPLCIFYTYPCDTCNNRRTNCNCTGGNDYDTITVNFTPTKASVYKLAVYGGLHTRGLYVDVDPDMEDRYYQCSNEFDSRIKPANFQSMFSTNGCSLAHAGTNIVGIAAVLAVLSIKINFND
ncbi:uncharacterized protein LOC131939645 [Physella acuta]|uniref:uncharacterized protein LOC131939645 n=1 Tax=Physella acuta TaxID=109671 RepID=UPI0027DAC4D3|nr:uncharacterized protein LOC131939645 [Physella acuta]XP_059154068.1 uncharacterized protein LOC131939645 [Physella acuta]